MDYRIGSDAVRFLLANSTTNSTDPEADDPLNIIKADKDQEVIDSQIYPFCFLQSKNKEFCYTQQFSIVLLGLCAIAFIYQIIFVWMLSF